jgi:hypothetical protein
MSCPFCPPALDPAQVILENTLCLFLQQAEPVLLGSGLVIPRQHRETVFDLTADEWQAGCLAGERPAIDIDDVAETGGQESFSGLPPAGSAAADDEQRLVTRGCAGSHDPLLDWAVRQSGCGLALRAGGSLDGLDALAAGSALAAIGGGMWATFVKSIHPAMGGEVIVFALIVAIIGGLGSITGSVVGALMVGLSYNYVAYLVPKAALGITMLLLIIILSIRPTGLFPEGT